MLFDTNVVLDVLLDREPFAATATPLLAAVENSELIGYLGATTVTTLHYLAVKAVGQRQARQHIGQLLRLFQVAPVNRMVLESALALEFSDFEDAVLHEAGRLVGVQAIVTRDSAGFARASLAVHSPL
ncbi:MAG: PIN domain-containing protein [Candidatus Competibacteraceae bacterium]|nr:PIN domain-containing protein [Candidatus Competibacteraceae bacterium]